jgi:hypothetical protein
MRKGIFLLVFISGALTASSQDSLTVSQKFKYFFTINTGFLGGERMKSLTFSANTVHGVTVGNRLRIGTGIGIDSYYDVRRCHSLDRLVLIFFNFQKGVPYSCRQIMDGHMPGHKSRIAMFHIRRQVEKLMVLYWDTGYQRAI